MFLYFVEIDDKVELDWFVLIFFNLGNGIIFYFFLLIK